MSEMHIMLHSEDKSNVKKLLFYNYCIRYISQYISENILSYMVYRFIKISPLAILPYTITLKLKAVQLYTSVFLSREAEDL